MIEIKRENVTDISGIKFVAEQDGKIVGRAFLYVLKNELHQNPRWGFLEDVFVEEEYRKHGIGSRLVEADIAEAKFQGSYNLICTSRNEKPELHSYYEKFGFKNYGLEFRMDLS